MTGALVKLLEACQAAGVKATAEDVVDAAWLARWMTAAPTAPAAEASRPEESSRDLPEVEPPAAEGPAEPLPLEKEVEPPGELPESPELPPELEPVPEAAGDSIGVYLPSGQKQPGAAGRVFRAPAAPALPQALDIARALRPLIRRVASRTQLVLDEAETIRRFADEGVCNPVLRPGQERWLRLALVIDTGTGSDLWRETAREFRALLACLGAFRDVRTWSLDTGASPPRLTPGSTPEGAARQPRELIDASGRTLTIVLSPCIAAGWHNGSVAGVLDEWAAGPVALVQLLPEYLWPRTALAAATGVQVTAPGAGAANRRLKSARPDAWPGEEAPEGVAVPVAVLEPASLRRWAGLVAGRPDGKAPGFVLDTAAAPSPSEEPTPLAPPARVQQFRETSSPLARRLAGLLAAAPVINLPIIRLVREAILPRAGQPQEAEVLFGGLLTRVAAGAASDPRFEFLPGVREALLDAVPTDESIPVLAAVSDYLEEHLGANRTFSAVLADPASAAGELVADASPFARIAAEVLLRAGGDYAKLVGRKKAPVARPQPPEGAPTPPPTGEAEPPPSPAEEREQLLEADPFPDFAQESDSQARDPEETDAELFPLDDATDSDRPAGVARVELEALVAIEPDSANSPKQSTWRRSLPPNRPVKLGRDPEFSDWTVPEDRLISRFHAVLEWDGVALTVTRRGVQHPNFPTPPANQIWFNNKPVEQCTVQPGEWFVIGRTRFSLHLAPGPQPAPDATAYLPYSAGEETGSRLDPAAILRAVERFRRDVQLNLNTTQSFWPALLASALEAFPRVDVATVVHVPRDDQPQQSPIRKARTSRSHVIQIPKDDQPVQGAQADGINTLMTYTRPDRPHSRRAPQLNAELVHNAVNVHRRSCSELSEVRYLTAGFEDPEADWAICTPLQDGSRRALYLAGEVNHEWNLPGDASDLRCVRENLAHYERVAELLVAQVEVARRRARLERQQRAMLRTMPESLRKHAENTEELERLLAPRELEVTALFCNLRDYASYASQHLDQLPQAQREVAGALDVRAKAVTESGGVVCGRQGEAILGVWGWPRPQPGQAEAAARVLAQPPHYRGLLHLRFGMGLTHGVAVAGRLNPHDASAVEAFGPSVSLAEQLSELARVFGVGIVTDEAFAAQLQAADPSGDRWHIRRLGLVRLPGRPPVKVHELNWTRGGHWFAEEGYRELLTLWHEAVEFFTGGNWRQAREALEADFTNDPVARHLLRIMGSTDRKPPEDWDGALNRFPPKDSDSAQKE